jgi:hypothetical protein
MFIHSLLFVINYVPSLSKLCSKFQFLDCLSKYAFSLANLLCLPLELELLLWSVHQIFNIFEQHGVELFLRVTDRIGITIFHVRAQVVDITVFGLVSTHGVYELQDVSLLAKLPIAPCNTRG